MNLEVLCREVNLGPYDNELISENGKRVYRVYVMKPLDEKGERRGVNLDGCARLSEISPPIFDVGPPVSGEYFLEVSSTRPKRGFNKIKHFVKSINELVKITTSEKEKTEARVISVEDENVTLEDLGNQEKTTLKLSDIKKARTFIRW